MFNLTEDELHLLAKSQQPGASLTSDELVKVDSIQNAACEHLYASIPSYILKEIEQAYDVLAGEFIEDTTFNKGFIAGMEFVTENVLAQHPLERYPQLAMFVMAIQGPLRVILKHRHLQDLRQQAAKLDKLFTKE